MDHGRFHQRLMEPFRAFVKSSGKTTYHGICHAKFFIGIGAYFASKLPLILLIRSSNTAP
jgi:hypothetical protein